jgi:hypothetical protein
MRSLILVLALILIGCGKENASLYSVWTETELRTQIALSNPESPKMVVDYTGGSKCTYSAVVKGDALSGTIELSNGVTDSTATDCKGLNGYEFKYTIDGSVLKFCLGGCGIYRFYDEYNLVR